MPVTATLRVVYPSNGSVENRRSLIHAAAERLRELGFEVLTEGRISIIVQADARQFSRVLGVPALTPNMKFVSDVYPSERSLVGLVDRVEVAGPSVYAG